MTLTENYACKLMHLCMRVRAPTGEDHTCIYASVLNAGYMCRCIVVAIAYVKLCELNFDVRLQRQSLQWKYALKLVALTRLYMYVCTMHMHPHTHTHTQLQWIVFRTLLPMLVLALGHLMTSQCDPSQENLERKLALQCRICIYLHVCTTYCNQRWTKFKVMSWLTLLVCCIYMYLSMCQLTV